MESFLVFLLGWVKKGSGKLSGTYYFKAHLRTKAQRFWVKISTDPESVFWGTKISFELENPSLDLSETI